MNVASDTELQLIANIFKEVARISSAGGNVAAAGALIDISAGDFDPYAYTHPNVTTLVHKNWMELMLAQQFARLNPRLPFSVVRPHLSLDQSGMIWINKPVSFRPLPPSRNINDILNDIPKKLQLPVPVDPKTMTKEQIRYLRQLRFASIRSRVLTSTGICAGLSVVLNVGDLFKGEISTYAINVAKDTGIAAGTSILGSTLEGIPVLAEGAGVIVLGIIDAAIAINTGDWKRFGLNVGLNACSTAGAIGLGKGGAALGTMIAPGIGTAVGTITGVLIGAIAGRKIAQKTPLGNLTDIEVATAVKEHLNKEFRELGMELHPDLTLEQITQQAKTGQFKLVISSDVTGAISADTLRAMIPQDTVQDLLREAARISPQNREMGLRKIIEALHKI